LKGGETMLKIYIVDGRTYQFQEGEQPGGAIEVKAEPSEKAEKPETKAAKPANKSRAVKNK